MRSDEPAQDGPADAVAPAPPTRPRPRAVDRRLAIAGLAALIGVTSLAVAWVDPRLLVPFAMLMAWLLLSPSRASSGAAPRSSPSPSPAPSPAESAVGRRDRPDAAHAPPRALGRNREGWLARLASSKTAAPPEPPPAAPAPVTEAADPGPPPDEPKPAKPRRSRKRKSSKKDEPELDPASVVWVRVDNNKFVRREVPGPPTLAPGAVAPPADPTASALPALDAPAPSAAPPPPAVDAEAEGTPDAAATAEPGSSNAGPLDEDGAGAPEPSSELGTIAAQEDRVDPGAVEESDDPAAEDDAPAIADEPDDLGDEGDDAVAESLDAPPIEDPSEAEPADDLDDDPDRDGGPEDAWEGDDDEDARMAEDAAAALDDPEAAAVTDESVEPIDEEALDGEGAVGGPDDDGEADPESDEPDDESDLSDDGLTDLDDEPGDPDEDEAVAVDGDASDDRSDDEDEPDDWLDDESDEDEPDDEDDPVEDDRAAADLDEPDEPDEDEPDEEDDEADDGDDEPEPDEPDEDEQADGPIEEHPDDLYDEAIADLDDPEDDEDEPDDDPDDDPNGAGDDRAGGSWSAPGPAVAGSGQGGGGQDLQSYLQGLINSAGGTISPASWPGAPPPQRPEPPPPAVAGPGPAAPSPREPEAPPGDGDRLSASDDEDDAAGHRAGSPGRTTAAPSSDRGPGGPQVVTAGAAAPRQRQPCRSSRNPLPPPPSARRSSQPRPAAPVARPLRQRLGLAPAAVRPDRDGSARGRHPERARSSGTPARSADGPPRLAHPPGSPAADPPHARGPPGSDGPTDAPTPGPFGSRPRPAARSAAAIGATGDRSQTVARPSTGGPGRDPAAPDRGSPRRAPRPRPGETPRPDPPTGPDPPARARTAGDRPVMIGHRSTAPTRPTAADRPVADAGPANGPTTDRPMTTPALLLLIAAFLPASPFQDEPEPAEAAPTPSLFPEGYLGFEALSDRLRTLADDHPDAVALRSLAKTPEGRDVWLVTLGKRPVEDEPAPPAVLIVANLEADHLVGSQVALGLVERLAGGSDEETITKFLDEHTLYVVPRLNPDGAERLLGTPRRSIRTNVTPTDEDRDGRSDEDGPDDLDGDGLILTMRVKDEDATLVPDDEDPRILRPAKHAEGERPVYSEADEGRDDDGDGDVNEDPVGGVNLNRNWPHNWSEFTDHAGFSPASEPEVHALIQFCYDHPEIAVIWSFTLHDNLRTEPKKPASTLNDDDLPYFAELSEVYRELIAPPKPETETEQVKEPEEAAEPEPEAPADQPEAEPVITGDDPLEALPAEVRDRLMAAFEDLPEDEQEELMARYRAASPEDRAKMVADFMAKADQDRPAPDEKGTTPKAGSAPSNGPALGATTDGAISEWAYHQFGTVALASSLWPGPILPDPADGEEKPPADGEARWLYWNDEVMGGRAFVPFREVEHPTFGTVELGGWLPGVRVNPPIEEVEGITDDQLAFLADLAGRLATLAIVDAKAEARGGGVFEVTARVENAGYFPTALAQGVATRQADPVLVRLKLGDAKLLAGEPLDRIRALDGSGGMKEYRWLVLAPDGVESIALEASCPRAGRVVETIDLP